MKSLKELITEAAKMLGEAGVPDPIRESYSLMAFAIRREPSFLRAHPEFLLEDPEKSRFVECVNRRIGREPFQHIVGTQEFYGLEFEVNRSVLVPRPETELIVEAALEYGADIERLSLCDIGTGSGCLAVSILSKIPDASAIAADISYDAVEVALRNAHRNLVDDRLSFVVTDGFQAITPKRQFDLIVANPPYIPVAHVESLQPEVRRFDPLVALTDGKDGLSIVRMIAEESPAYLKPGGVLLMEIGFSQSEKALAFFSRGFWRSTGTKLDLQSIPRMVIAVRE